jgi:hypothetical protein
MKVSASIFGSHYSVDKAQREAITWAREHGMRCGRCGGVMLLGTFDAEPVALACQECPAVFFHSSPSSSSSTSQSALA